MRVWYNGRTSAFQADDAGSIPATRSYDANIMKRIRNFFKVESNFQLLIVNIVFAVTGTLSVYFAGFILELFDITLVEYTKFQYWTLRILLLIPVYQFLLIIVGSIMGEFDYFWRMEKKMLGRFGIHF